MNNLTEQIIGCAYTVGNKLGYGFLEKVYEKALAIELEKIGLQATLQKPLQVEYEGVIIGEYFADIVVEEKIIIELKAAKNIDNTHLAQCLNYLKVTGLKIGLLINFSNSGVQVKRVANNF